jgi:hypothetical protein
MIHSAQLLLNEDLNPIPPEGFFLAHYPSTLHRTLSLPFLGIIQMGYP